MKIRPFHPDDRHTLTSILERNDQLNHPLVDGPDAMCRVSECSVSFFYVAEYAGEPIGLIRGNYDGSRAIINELSVDPDQQKLGAGTQLVEAALAWLIEKGAPTVAVTVSETSSSYWSRFGFEMLPVMTMLKTLAEPDTPLSACTRYIGETLTVSMDRPMGSKHPEHGHVYPINYGYIPGTKAEDGEEQDAYVLGVFEPIEQIEAVCIAVIHRADDAEDKLVVSPGGQAYSDDQIVALTEFQERFFHSTVLRNRSS
jgi:inorganic pyrophosphatase